MGSKTIGTRPDFKKIRRLTPEQVAEQALLDLEAIAGSPQGRRVLWHIITESGLFARIRAPNPDIHWLEGRRDVGAWLVDWLDAVEPNLVPLMMQEAVNAKLLGPVQQPSDDPNKEAE